MSQILKSDAMFYQGGCGRKSIASEPLLTAQVGSGQLLHRLGCVPQRSQRVPAQRIVRVDCYRFILLLRQHLDILAATPSKPQLCCVGCLYEQGTVRALG
mmetsp:Transcript_121295/g.234011  ORF Transcript_121295/g.234011 Transcript_121295/m.234011 type:complete len:100 (+) Transcript_121295:88-387(+)